MNLPGVLILNQNKTYGKTPKDKFLYKCIPDDKTLDSILIPYEIKNMEFSKYFKNNYIIFKLQQDDLTRGVLIHTIGPVDINANYYEYQLYRKNLYHSLQTFTTNTKKALSNNSNEDHIKMIVNIGNIVKKYPNIQDRSSYKVFSIDPSSTLDYDDAFSINRIDSDTIVLSIYISNVSIWIEILNLFNNFDQKVSSIYMPDKVHPMLPTILSTNTCSLKSNQDKIALVMDIRINNQGAIIDISYHNAIINLYRNYSYEEPNLLKDPNYIMLRECVKTLSNNYKLLSTIEDSHDVVAYLMIMMNHYVGKKLQEYQTGIFRSTKENISNKDLLEKIPDEIKKFISIYSSNIGEYTTDYNKDHQVLELDAYVHITSPIRRICDILNQIIFQEKMGLIKFSERAIDFYKEWLSKIDFINLKTKSIKSVQRDANLLDMYTKNPILLETIYDGYIIGVELVYIPELKITSKIKYNLELELYSKIKVKLYLFENEYQIKKKIRCAIV
jgi:exoribonuclease R